MVMTVVGDDYGEDNDNGGGGGDGGGGGGGRGGHVSCIVSVAGLLPHQHRPKWRQQ